MIVEKLSGLVRRNSFVSSVGKLVSAHLLGQALLLAVMPLVTRLYTPADFGVFAVFVAILTLVLVCSSLRYELAIPLPRGEANAFAALLLALWLNVAVAVISALVVLPLGGDVSRLLNAPGLDTVLWLLPLSLLGAGTNRALRYWAIRHHDFGALARTQLTQSAANAAFQVGGGSVGLGGAGLAIGHLLGLTAGAYRLARGLGPRLRGAGRRQRLRMRSVARRYIRFPKFDVAGAFVDTLSVQLPNLLLPLLFNPAVAGAYLLADRVLGMPLSLLSQSIGQVLYARSREAVEQGRMAALASKMSVTLLAAVSVPAAVMFMISEPLIVFVFGEAWREAGSFARWLTVGFIGQFVFSSVSLVLMATNAQSLNLALHLIMLTVRSAALLYGYAEGSALAAIIALAFAHLIGYLGATAVIMRHAYLHDRGRAPRPVVRERV